jgi:hypothetical protein
VNPFYANAEILSEKEIEVVGNFLTDTITKPVLVSRDMRLYDMLTWIRHREMKNCSCRIGGYNCGTVDEYKPTVDVNKEILLTQWLTLSLRAKASQSPTSCVMVRKDIIQDLNKIFLYDISPADCSVIGCPYLPMVVNDSNPSMEFCEPISFGDSQSEVMKSRAEKAHSPFNWGPNQLFNFLGSKRVYLLVNGTLRFVPNMETIYRMNLDMTKLQRMRHPREVAPIGDPL